VEVIGRYSNTPRRVSDLGELLSRVRVTPVKRGDLAPPRQRHRRLRDRTTRSGRRWRVLEVADIDQAASLYATGLSCASIAETLGVHTNTVYLALTKVGGRCGIVMAGPECEADDLRRTTPPILYRHCRRFPVGPTQRGLALARAGPKGNTGWCRRSLGTELGPVRFDHHVEVLRAVSSLRRAWPVRSGWDSP